ncbi:sigma-B regulation protein RsbU (phosphoserine phosphatase) [Litoreibacter janthinus]|uniref:histidine kinase n=2 Tax=Litoreibacter janthinus TaxID=670154 RepID=A0A1I6H697_9RHOB|nr:sigma-B regulation protein RsbU (phosphoserine phosphatase) [Litoreibacter janthinus]
MQSSAPCGVLKTDHLGTVLVANERLGEWLGLSAADLCGTPLAKLFSKASMIVFETSIVPLLTLKGQIDGASLDLVNSEGAKTPVLLSAGVSGSGENTVTTFVFLLADARRAFERDLAKAKVEAETLLTSSQREGELREQFIAILGHDLRNPLASIASAMNILSRETLSEKNERIVTLTRGSIQRMSLLIDNILDFARNRLGDGINLTLSEGATLESEIEQVVAELRSVHPDRDVLLDLRNADDVKCDVPRLGQLLSNLLGNAITYGDPKRPIHVVARKSADNYFELSVKNYGPPIPPCAIERLFDPFVRSNNHGDQIGLGLGLYIASEIAKAHDGSLDVRSTESHTIFSLRIPER